jgi:hypothetical protein
VVCGWRKAQAALVEPVALDNGNGCVVDAHLLGAREDGFVVGWRAIGGVF